MGVSSSSLTTSLSLTKKKTFLVLALFPTENKNKKKLFSSEINSKQNKTTARTRKDEPNTKKKKEEEVDEEEKEEDTEEQYQQHRDLCTQRTTEAEEVGEGEEDHMVITCSSASATAVTPLFSESPAREEPEAAGCMFCE